MLTHMLPRNFLSKNRKSRHVSSYWHRIVSQVLFFIHVQSICSLFLTLTLALMPPAGASPVRTTRPQQIPVNMSDMDLKAVNSNVTTSLSGGQKLFSSAYNNHHLQQAKNNSTAVNVLNGTQSSNASNSTKDKTAAAGVKRTHTASSGPSHYANSIPREFPVALVTAASVAAFCILVFFLLAYIWHTRQLDSRARKIAIRLAAADVETSRGSLSQSPPHRCRNCMSRSGNSNGGRLASSSSYSGRYTLAPAITRPESASSSQGGQYEPLTCLSTSNTAGGGSSGKSGDDERITTGRESVSGRSSVGVSESEAGDCEDVFEPSELPVIPADRLKSLRGSIGRNSHRKWSRSGRKSGSGPCMEKRDSAVTDKEILSHFASRRHSTFFI